MENNSKVNRKGQQEMVGFVLIVVLVVVVMMVFLVISLKKPSIRETESLEVTNMLDSILEYTTDCAIVFVPQYESVEELFKSAFEGKKCSNLGILAEPYLKDTLGTILGNITKTDSLVLGYNLQFIERVGESETIKFEIPGGDCLNSKKNSFAQKILVSGASRLIIRLKLCEN